MKKKIVSIILSSAMLLGVFSLSACTNSELEAKLEELQTKIEQLQDQNEDLQASVTQQQGQIAGLEQKNEDLQASVSDQQTKIETLEQEKSEFEEQIKSLETQLNQNAGGTFYSLGDAYEKGLLTKENITTIAYYQNNNVKYPNDLPDNVANTIKVAWAKKLQNDKIKPIPEATAESIIIVKYYGTYNNNVVVMLQYYTMSVDIDRPAVVIEVGGISINLGVLNYDEKLVVWHQ